MFSYKKISYCVTASICLTGYAHAEPLVAIDWGGDYRSGNSNSGLGNLQLIDQGDFNGDGNANDQRWYVPIDHPGIFINTPAITDGSYAGVPGNVMNAGVQIVTYDQSPAILGGPQLLRYNDAGTNDHAQLVPQWDLINAGTAFAPHFRKSNFSNGLGGADNLSFLDVDGSLSFDVAQPGTANPSATPPGERRIRALVQDGTDWYISGFTSGSRDRNTYSLNPFQETWYPYDPSTNFFYEEVGSGDTTPTTGPGVSGSSLNDIQSLGVLFTNTNYFENNRDNRPVLQLYSFDATLDAVLPEPAAAPYGDALVSWQMESTSIAVRDDEGFGNTFTGDAVPDTSQSDRDDPLFFGVATATNGVGTFDPPQPTLVPGPFGQALKFEVDGSGVGQEAIGIVAWPADPNDVNTTPHNNGEGINSLYVDAHFNADSFENGQIQSLVGVRSTWALRILPSGDLEFLTFMESGTNSIQHSLDGEDVNAWHRVQAWEDSEGNKVLMLNGEIVGFAATDGIEQDSASIMLGNRPGRERYYGGLIDKVYVGTGLLQGDANIDGNVDLIDLSTLATNFDTAVDGFTHEKGDFNGDGFVDLIDLSLLATNFNGGGGGSSVPEPASAFLGLAALALVRRR